MSDTYDPYSWALDAIAFERWFHGEEDESPRIGMVHDVLAELDDDTEELLTEYFWERLSMRDLVKRHSMGNPWYAHQAVHAALDKFKQEWIKQHGDLV